MSSPPVKVKSPSSLAHVVLRTGDFEAITFSFLTYDDEHHRVAIIGVPGTKAKQPGSAGLEHIAFAFDSLDDLALTYTQRKAWGITPTVCINHGPTTSIYYTDPDGNMIETQVDNFDTPEEATQFMMSEAFRINPIGTDFDPEDLIKRLESGESHGSIKKRIEIGPRSWLVPA